MRSSRPSSQRIVVPLLLAVATVGCRGCGDSGGDPERTICENAQPYPAVNVHWGEMPEGDSSAEAVALSISPANNTTSASSQLEVSYSVPFTGGPLTGVRIAIGSTCYFEVPINLALANDPDPDTDDPISSEAYFRSIEANNTEGRIYISGEVSAWLDLPDAVAAGYAFQVRGEDEEWSPTAQGGQVTLCTEDDDCTPSGPGGGGALASCSDQNACLELTGGDVAPFQAQCEGEGGNFTTSACPSNGGGPTCLGATITSSGVRLPANVYWASDFCSRNPGIDTRNTCLLDLGGTPSGTHCTQ